MNRKLIIALFVLANSTIAFAQFEKGNTELTLSGTAGYQKESPSFTSNNPESLEYCMLNICVGYYIVNGFSVEPQIGFLAIDKSYPSQSALLNLSYTYRISHSALALFVCSGYGLSNSLCSPVIGFIPLRSEVISDVHIINAGAGIKILMMDNVILRIEANYHKESFEYDALEGLYYDNDTIMYYTKTEDSSISYVGVLFGFSIIL